LCENKRPLKVIFPEIS